MPRKFKVDPDLVCFAEELVVSTNDAHELRCAQAVLLPVRFGLTAAETGEAIGRSRATVGRLQTECRARMEGVKISRDRWGGRRRQNLTLEEEAELLRPFFEKAKRGGVLVVGPIKKAYEQRVGHSVPDSTIYRVLARHGWRKIVPDRRHPKSDPEAQEAWKKNSSRR